MKMIDLKYIGNEKMMEMMEMKYATLTYK